MLINEIEFLNIEHSAFRELESLFSEKLLNLVDDIQAGNLTAEILLKFNSDIMEGITTAEEKIINPLLEKASREAITEIFTNETNSEISEQ